jgi:hypothetical protein
MKFENVYEWINFNIEQPIESLNTLISDEYNLYEDIEDQNNYIVDSNLLLFCLGKFKGAKIEDSFWSNTLCFLDNDWFPETIFNYLYENKLALTTMCHLPLRDEFLWKLVNTEEEAILTLGTRYYTLEKYSIDAFERFLLRFKTCNWLWRCLISTTTSDTKKKKLFRRLLFNNTKFHDYKVLIIEKTIEERLKKTHCIKLINKYYKLNNCRYYVGIAQNPNTPINILEELLQLKNVKYAKLIREFSLNNINKRCK